MKEQRRPLREFPEEWFSAESVTPTGGSEPREENFMRPAHARELLAGVRQAFLAKPKDALLEDKHVYFSARTWKDRPSLRRNLDNIKARVHRVLTDGTVIASWRSHEDYEETKHYIDRYAVKRAKAVDLDFVESIHSLDHRAKLGYSLLEVLEEKSLKAEGLFTLVFYPEYDQRQVREMISTIEHEFKSRALRLERIVDGLERHSAVFRGPLYLTEEIARRVEAAALVEQVTELEPAAVSGKAGPKPNVSVVVRSDLPEVGIFDTGVAASHPLLAGVLLTGDPAIDHVDGNPDGGHGTFVAGILAYDDNPESQIRNGQITPRALIHPRKVTVADAKGGINLDSYQELDKVVMDLRSKTRVFTASLSTRIPIDSDNISEVALNIDLLSYRHGVLFILPIGNLPNLRGDTLSPHQPNYSDVESWFADRNAGMGRPGEAFNALTVSSCVERQVGDEHSAPWQLAVYSRRGPGPKDIPKPDLSAVGGNCVLQLDPAEPWTPEFSVDDHPEASLTGLRSPKGTTKSYGTSFAVPRVAFALAALVKQFEDLGQAAAAPLLAKAYLLHVCRVPKAAGPFPAKWNEKERAAKRHLLYGHGVIDPDALGGVLPSELCFYNSAEISRRERHVYSLRLPTNVLKRLPDLLLRVTLTYFTKVDANVLDAELYSLVDIAAIVRWGGKTLSKVSRGGPLTEYYPVKSFEVHFSKPREGTTVGRGQPTVEVVMKDRVLDQDELKERYAIVISLVSPSGDFLINDLVQEVESA